MESLFTLASSLKSAFAATSVLTNNPDTCKAAGTILGQYETLDLANSAIQSAVAPRSY